MAELEKKGSRKNSGGGNCTFQVTVRFRQNSTWQGSILWMEQNETQNFRSVLEMLRLMDEALTEGTEDTEKPNWGK